VGLGIGSLVHTDPTRIAAAAAIGVAAGMLRSIRRAWVTGATSMAVIGVAFAEFGPHEASRMTMNGHYLLGTAIVSLVVLGLWLAAAAHGETTARLPTAAPVTNSDWSWCPTLARGVRLGWCLGIATAVTVVLHQHSHSYWIPLTVTVLIRQEASIPVRTLHRLTGTLGGVLVAGLVALAAGNDRSIIAVLAAVSVGIAVAGAPRLYALTVAGLTCSALLIGAITAAGDSSYAKVRLVDTLIGTAITLIFGTFCGPLAPVEGCARRPEHCRPASPRGRPRKGFDLI
jgi:hypothetical protein